MRRLELEIERDKRAFQLKRLELELSVKQAEASRVVVHDISAADIILADMVIFLTSVSF